MKIRLAASLDRPGGTVIVCCSCRAEIGATVTPRDHRGVCSLRDVVHQDVWRLSRHTEESQGGPEG
jgi:hypothetical protein